MAGCAGDRGSWYMTLLILDCAFITAGAPALPFTSVLGGNYYTLVPLEHESCIATHSAYTIQVQIKCKVNVTKVNEYMPYI